MSDPFYFKFNPREWFAIGRKMTKEELGNYLMETVEGLIASEPTTDIAKKMWEEVENYRATRSEAGRKGAEIKRKQAQLKLTLSSPEAKHKPEAEAEAEAEAEHKNKRKMPSLFSNVWPDTKEKKEEWISKLPEDWTKEKCLHYWEQAYLWSESKGEKMLNWVAAVRNWDRKNPYRQQQAQNKPKGMSFL